MLRNTFLPSVPRFAMVGLIEYIVIAVLILSLILTRNIHEFAMPGVARDADGYVHMVIAREFRENQHRVPKNISASIFDWTFSYPFLVHFLLSFLPERYYESVDRVFPTVMDLLYVGFLSTLVPLGLLESQDFPLMLALFVATPQFVQYAGGKGLSARKPGILLATVSFLSFVIWNISGGSWILFASIIFAGITHLTSRFGTQAIVFFYLGFALLNPVALLIIIGSFIFAELISLGTYHVVLRSHLNFWFDYATRKQFVFLYNGFKSSDTIKQFLKARNLKEVLGAVYNSILLKALLNNPYAISATVLIIWSFQSSSFSIPVEVIIWFGVGLILCLFTTIYGLRFLGQPGRYLNYAFIPGILITVEGIPTLPIANRILLVILFGAGLAMIGGQALAYKRLSASLEQQQALDEAIEFLNLCDEGMVLVQPRHLGSEVAWKASGISVSDFFGNGFSSQAAKKQAEKVFPNEPYISDDIELLSKMLNPDLLLFSKSMPETIDGLRPGTADTIHENEFYALYRWDDIIK